MYEKMIFGQVGRLKKDMIEEYEALHANPWPHVLQLIHDCNLRNYSIFRQDDLVFAYFEYVGEDFDADMEKMAARRVRCLRTNEEKDFGPYTANFDEQYAVMLESDVPVVAQYGRAEPRQVAFYTTPGYCE